MSSQIIGRYQIERQLGEGGMAVVYLAYDPNTARKVVVKVIRREYGASPEFQARFNREAKMIAKLEHEAIVPVYDFGEYEGQPYIVMRQMAGGSLADRLEKGPLPLPETARIIEQIADALDYTHGQRIVHRDLKPGNILFDDRGKAYLSDFGIAKSVEATAKLTGTGAIGTPAYMSPEQAQAVKDLDRRSDVYSLGVMTFELLTGELPFKARDAEGLMVAHISGPIPDIRKSNPDLPRESDGVIKRALAKKPDVRYQTARELAQALSKIATKPSAKPRFAWNAAAQVKPDTPPKPKTLPGDLQPTIPPEENGKTQARPVGLFTNLRQIRWPRWLIPVGFVGFCIVALVGGLLAVPGLLAARTPAGTAPGTETRIAIVTRSVPAIIRTSTKTPAPPSATPTATIAPLPTLGVGSTRESRKDGMVLVFVPAGDFLMGSADTDALANRDEKPQHTVSLNAFWIDQTEVTNSMYRLCVDDGGCNAHGSSNSATRDAYSGSPSYVNYPVIYVSWDDATKYCSWAGRRLPTEAEWEKAARGEEGQIYPWGSNAPDANLLNFNLNVGDTTEVGNYSNGMSPYGAFDMAGNVWEWVNDWYSDSYYSSSPTENPQGLDLGQAKVLRGGSWSNPDNSVRAADRGWNGPSARHPGIGFRCALSL
jgi:eukaryotic-like serine/threonine-protein kinase